MRISYPLLSGALIGLGGALILFRSLFEAASQWVLWSGTGDSRLMLWIVSWGYHILIERHDPANFWNANQFYPNPFSLAYSDSLLTLQVLYIPFRLLGIGPLPALYLGLASTLVVSCALTFFALQRIGGLDWLEMALVTFAANLCLPMVTLFYHFQLFGFTLAIPFFLFLYLYLRDFRTVDLLAVCLLYAAAAAYATYLAPILFALALFLAAPWLARLFFRRTIRMQLRSQWWKQALIAVIIGAALYYVQLRPYTLVTKDMTPTPVELIPLYSANLNSILADFPDHSYWYQPKSRSFGSHEYANFPGLSLLIPGALCLGLLAWMALRAVQQSHLSRAHAERPAFYHRLSAAWNTVARQRFAALDPGLVLFMALLFAISLIFSWGPFAKWNHEANLNIRLPYYWLIQFIPGLDRVRVPGRVGMFFGLPLGIFLVFLLRSLAPDPTSRRRILALFCLLAAVEALPVYQAVPFDPDPTGIYHQMGAAPVAGEVLVELPAAAPDILEPFLEQLVGSTFHWNRLVIGYGQRFSSEHTRLVTLDRHLQEGPSDIQPLINFTRRMRASYLLIHQDRYSPEIQAAWKEYRLSPKVCVLYQDQSLLWLGLNERACNR